MSFPIHNPEPRPPSLVRVFCAVELPEKVRARAAERITLLREKVGDVRASWERTEKMHITLKFLGEIESGLIASLSGCAERAARGIEPFELRIEGAGAFPPRGTPRVLWLGVIDAAGGLASLHQALEDECGHAGFARSEKSFHPHLTIARLRHPTGAHRLASLHQGLEFKSAPFPVAGLIVLRSELGPRGSSYTEISRHSLGAI